MRLLAALLISLLALTGLTALAPAAHAQTPGVTTNLLINGRAASPNTVITPGDTLRLNVQYSRDVVPGSTAVIELGGVPTSIDPASLVVPAGNTAIKSVTEHDGAIHITFADPFPDDVSQGVWALNYTLREVEVSGTEKVTWRVDDEEHSIEVVVRAPGDEFENVSSRVAKNAARPNWNSAVTIDDDGQVVLNPSIIGQKITYTLNVDTAKDQNRQGFTIADQLPEHLVLDPESFRAELTTWDDQGRNRKIEPLEFTPAVADGHTGFTHTLDLPNPSRLKVTYTASVPHESAHAALRDMLQVELDKLVAEDRTGNFGFNLRNTATFGDQQRTADVWLGGHRAGPPAPETPRLDSIFTKSGNWDHGRRDVLVDEGGTLQPAQDITYTLRANLSTFDGRNEHFVLGRNVVISDPLPQQARWSTDAADFITAQGMELTQAAGFSGTAEDFAADEYVGHWAVVNQLLLVNLGRNQSDVTVAVKAQVTTIEDLYAWKNPNNGSTHYPLRNRASFIYSEEKAAHEREAAVDLIVWDESDDGRHDPDKFSKTALSSETITVVPGETTELDYRFTVQNVDLTKSYIVDYVNPEYFETSNVEEIAAAITGKFNWWHEMDATYFDVSVDDDGNLIIKLSDKGINLVKDNPTARLEVTITLTTVPLAGKQTLSITNKASLFGQDEVPIYWSEVRAEATSYGDEAQVRKSIRDTENRLWTTNLRAEVNDEGELVQDEYVYNIAFIPHGNYDGVPIIPVIDNLPEEVEFLGFVTDENVDTGAGAVAGPVEIGGNLIASYDAENHRVTLANKQGEVLSKQDGISANVLVRITSFELDTPIINVIGNTSATVTPSDGYPVSIAKRDRSNDNVVIDDPNARFEIRTAAGEVVVDNAYVKDGFLAVDDSEGRSRSVLVPEPGTYFVREVVAPKGYELSEQEIRVTVEADGSTETVTFFNTPAEPSEPTYAVGDYVWIDTNKDGLQGEDEQSLEGVTVVLLDADGEEVARTSTDENGLYIFDELPAGEYQIRFELTQEQAELYEFTIQTVGDDVTADSNADPVTGLTARFRLDSENAQLTKDYGSREVLASEGIDPTWDAGVILKVQPTEPVEPAEPSEPPTEPNEPTDPPTEPNEPTDPPTEPADPTDPPSEPSEPTDPPAEPADPTDPPSEPSEPSEPTNPPTEPSEPTDPPTEPSEPTDPPTEPSEPTDPPTEPSEPTDPPTEPSEPTDPPTEPSEPVTPTHPPTVPAEPTDPPTQPSEPTDPPTEPSEPAEPSDPPSEPADPADPPTEPSEPAAPSTPATDPTDPSHQPTEPADPSESPTPAADPSNEPQLPTPAAPEPDAEDEDAPKQPGSLAQTGAGVGMMLAAVTLLLAAGGSLLVWRNRRQA
ncbi:hypothetical protein GCM10025777_49270 [Membranihabitans marinus]